MRILAVAKPSWRPTLSPCDTAIDHIRAPEQCRGLLHITGRQGLAHAGTRHPAAVDMTLPIASTVKPSAHLPAAAGKVASPAFAEAEVVANDQVPHAQTPTSTINDELLAPIALAKSALKRQTMACATPASAIAPASRAGSQGAPGPMPGKEFARMWLEGQHWWPAGNRRHARHRPGDSAKPHGHDEHRRNCR
jgi:hypothetical protein